MITSVSWLTFEFRVKRQKDDSLIGLSLISFCFEIATLLLILH